MFGMFPSFSSDGARPGTVVSCLPLGMKYHSRANKDNKDRAANTRNVTSIMDRYTLRLVLAVGSHFPRFTLKRWELETCSSSILSRKREVGGV